MFQQGSQQTVRTRSSWRKGAASENSKLEQFGTVYCERPVTWKGQWRDIKGEVWMVEACERHRPDAENEPPLTPAA